MRARPFFFIRRCLEVEARRCRGKDIACPFPVSAPLCGASSYAPVVNNACSTRRQVCEAHVGCHWQTNAFWDIALGVHPAHCAV